MNERLRSLPSVEALVSTTAGLDRFPRPLVVEEARRLIATARQSILAGESAPADFSAALESALSALERRSLQRVINATGVVLHTNLGRAPVPPHFWPGGSYSTLEYDTATGKRGKRDSHFVPLLERLLGHPALAVNNGAAAVWLALRELAAGGEVIVSRGELIEIGDGFRIPDIMRESGAILVEVGTTNRTHLDDYRNSVNARTRLILRVHRSNFEMRGFTSAPELAELAAFAHSRELPLYEDLGSGNLWDLRDWGVREPTVAASLAAGVDLVSFSGDKLLGGPQAGIVTGRADLVARLRKHPMYRALRLDKLAVAALEAALRAVLLERWADLPAVQMIRESQESLQRRAERIAHLTGGTVQAGESVIGGGSTPEQALPTWLVVLEGEPVTLERELRRGNPPVIARIEESRVLLDPRTVPADEEPDLVAAVQSAMRRLRGVD